MTLKFIHTKIRKSTKKRNHPERHVLLREGWMQQSCGEVRWWLMYHFVKEMCQKRAWQSSFHTPHNAHECDEWRINTVERGFLMAWNLWSIKSGSSYEFWVVGGFFPVLIKMIFEYFSWFLKILFSLLVLSVDKNMDEILVGAVVFKEKIHFSGVKDYKEYVNFGAL